MHPEAGLPEAGLPEVGLPEVGCQEGGIPEMVHSEAGCPEVGCSRLSGDVATLQGESGCGGEDKSDAPDERQAAEVHAVEQW